MEDKLIELLEQFGFSVIRQGSLGADEPYPDSFFTFWNNSSEDLSHYDNKSYSYVWDFDLNFYSIEPKNVYNILDEAIKLLKANGFIISGKGHDVISDEPTHTGRGVNVRYREYAIKKGDDYMMVTINVDELNGIYTADKSYNDILKAIKNDEMVFVKLIEWKNQYSYYCLDEYLGTSDNIQNHLITFTRDIPKDRYGYNNTHSEITINCDNEITCNNY